MKFSRRKFLSNMITGTAGIPLFITSSDGWFRNAYGEVVSPDRGKGWVVISRDLSYQSFENQPGKALDKGMRTLLGTESLTAAWKKLFRSDDIVGIKVNTLSGRNLSPSYHLVQEVVKSLEIAGVATDRIIVWDRTSRELRHAGYPINMTGAGVRVLGTDSIEQNGNGYESSISTNGSIGSCFSKILTRHCTSLINIGVIKDHDIAGVSVMLKNYYGVIHNPNKYHSDHCSPYIAHLNAHELIRKKIRLNIVDAPIAQFHGGPAYNGNNTWFFGGLMLSFDAVAIDRLATDFIDSKRKDNGLKSLALENRSPLYIDEAGKLGLGECKTNAIKVINVE